MNNRKSILCLFLLFLLSLGSLSVNAQTVSKVFKEQTLKTVLKEIESQTGLSIIYQKNEINENKKVNATFENTPVVEALSSILDKSLEVSLRNKMIVISKKTVNSPSKTVIKQITGVIIDEQGEPVIGASVMVKGTSIGTITDVDGHYSLSNVPLNSIVNISYIGYKSLELKADNKTLAHITLKEDNEMLDEVVVVGYGTIKKANLSGAVGQISSKEIEHRISGNTGQTLQGLIPNLNVSFSDGAINKKASFDVRGVGSINGGSPLVLIDGVEGDLNYVNPKDIASVSVLRMLLRQLSMVHVLLLVWC